MELSAAIIVVISSRFGLPISTTHCLVGAVAGIGAPPTPGHAACTHCIAQPAPRAIRWPPPACMRLARAPMPRPHGLTAAGWGAAGLLEGRKGFNGVLLLRFFGGWIATLVVAGLTAAAFTAQGVYSPCNPAASQRSDMADYLINTTSAISAVSRELGMLRAGRWSCGVAGCGVSGGAWLNLGGNPCLPAPGPPRCELRLIHPSLHCAAPLPPQLLAGSGQPAAAASSAALNASLAALPVPLLNLQQGAAVQLQALQDYRAATAWVGNATSGS